MKETYNHSILNNEKRILESKSLDVKDKVKSLFVLFTMMTEDITENERLVFTTLFSRLAYIGNKYKIKSSDLHLMHLLRRANERVKYEKGVANYIDLASYCIKSLLSYVANGEKQKHSDLIENVFCKDKLEIVRYQPLISCLLIAIDLEASSIVFIDEKNAYEKLSAQFDISDKNEIFTDNLSSISRNIPLPVEINLIDVELMDDGTYVPQGLVLMPDYLVDVTSIATCFKEYGTETLLSVMSRMKPSEPTSIPLLIGNIANLFLDELVADPDISFKELLPKIFRYNPIVLSLFSDMEIKEIVAKAKIHFDNLKRVVKVEGPNLGLDKENIYLEPSFYSRDYGVQGRLDLFHHSGRDKKYDIIELKSGKPFRPNIYGLNNGHYIQTLLYDLLIKSTFGKAVKPASYILYSLLNQRSLKYAPPAKAQQYEAMKVRNELIILLYLSAYDTDKLGSLFMYLDPENFPKVKGFELSDIRLFRKLFLSLSSDEQSYFTEFVSFVKREQFLSKTGEHGIENSNGLAAIWLENYEEKEDRFAILRQLEILKNDSQEEMPTLTLEHSSFTNELANFREGDIAVLYPYHENPKAVMFNQVFKCSIIERRSDQIVVKLRSKQYNHSLFRKYKYWNIEEDKLDSSFNKSYQSLYKFIASSKEKRTLLMGLTPPQIEKISSNYSSSNGLTDEQSSLLGQMINAKDYYLLWGPPGTGKTSVMVKSYAQYLIEETDQNILLLAYTNRAVDELCAAIESIGGEAANEYIRIGSSTACNEKYRYRILDNLIKEKSTRQSILEVLHGKRVFVGTLSSMMNKPELFMLKEFKTAIIDEASQILEPNIIGLLTHISKFVLIGDHKQLPAVVQQREKTTKVGSEKLKNIGVTDMSMSFFERLYRQCLSKEWTHAYGLLSQQGRMHEELMAFPSEYFYESKLQLLGKLNRLKDKNWDLLSNAKGVPSGRLVFINSAIDNGVNYKTNENEADIVASLLEQYLKLYKEKGRLLTANEIGVITPYRAQIALIKNRCIEMGLDISNVTIDTVERYQGGARNLIIFSLCVNKERQFRSLVSLSSDGIDRKLNVALTRAKEQIIIVGAKEIIDKQETYKKLIESYTEWTPSINA